MSLSTNLFNKHLGICLWDFRTNEYKIVTFSIFVLYNPLKSFSYTLPKIIPLLTKSKLSLFLFSLVILILIVTLSLNGDFS